MRTRPGPARITPSSSARDPRIPWPAGPPKTSTTSNESGGALVLPLLLLLLLLVAGGDDARAAGWLDRSSVLDVGSAAAGW